MLELLTSLVLFILSSGPFSYPLIPEENIVDFFIGVVSSDQTVQQAIPQDEEQNDTEDEQFETEIEDQDDIENDAFTDDAENNAVNESNKPDTEKVRAYNTSSGKVIEKVAKVAVENAPPLVDCRDVPELCKPEITPSPTPTPKPEPTPTPYPLPDPIPSPWIKPPIPKTTIIPWPPCPDYQDLSGNNSHNEKQPFVDCRY